MVLENLLGSRRFWLAVVAMVVTAVGVAFPAVPPAIVDAFQKFAVVLISAFTLEDSALALAKK